jgi:antitoxin component of MazEF toxin-antitoxin module
MSVVKKLTRLGGSKAVVLPQAFLQQLNVPDTDEVELTLIDQGVLITPHRYAMSDEADASRKRMVAKHRRSLERLGR